MTKNTGSDKVVGWVVKQNGTNNILWHVKYDGKQGATEWAGFKWQHVSAFAWVDASVPQHPHFQEQGARDMMALYIAQTGDNALSVVKVEV